MFYLTFILSIPLAALVLLVIYYYWSRRHLYNAASKIKGPSGFPLIGNAHVFVGKNEELFDRINAILETVDNEPVKMWLGPFLLIALKNPEHLEKVMSAQKFSYKHEMYGILEKALGEGGLISASGLDPKIKSYRRKIAPLFDINFVATTFSILHEKVTFCLENLETFADEEEFDINETLKKLCVDFIAETILGEKLNVQKDGKNEILDAFTGLYDIVFMRLLKLWMYPDSLFNLWPGISQKFHSSLSIINKFIEECILNSWKRRKIFPVENKHQFIPAIDKLTETFEFNSKWMTKPDLVDNLKTLYTAAEDTITTILSFAVICFGMYPEYQEKAAEEIRNIIGETPRELTLEDMYKLEFLDRCIKEVLRLFPIAPAIIKRVLEDYDLDQWTIPRGAALVVSINSLHREPRYWENPCHFHPDHFLPEAVRNRHCYAYMPFSAGPRGCIGKTMANMTIKYILACFLQKFKVESKGKVPDLKLKSDISVRSRNGYKCKITKRIWK